MELELHRPLVFFDLETTGLDFFRDRIIEISILKVHPNQKEEILTLRVNPGIPIPPASTAVHGISDSDVANEPLFKEIAQQIVNFMANCDIAGYNSTRFDIPMLAEELYRADVDFDFSKAQRIDVQTIFHKMEKRTLEAAYQFYCGKTLTDAHSAAADTLATYHVLLAQLDKYSSLQNNVKFLAEFSKQNNAVDLAGYIVKNDKGVAVFNFGKHKGKPVLDVFKAEKGYYDWIMTHDFTEDTKRHFSKIYLELRNI